MSQYYNNDIVIALTIENTRLIDELAAAKEEITQRIADAKTVGETAFYWSNRAEAAEEKLLPLQEEYKLAVDRSYELALENAALKKVVEAVKLAGRNGIFRWLSENEIAPIVTALKGLDEYEGREK